MGGASLGAVYFAAMGAGALRPCDSGATNPSAMAALRRIGTTLHRQGHRAGRADRFVLSPGEDWSSLAARFERAVRDDFAAGRTVSCDGWILAQAEADLAVASLDFA